MEADKLIDWIRSSIGGLGNEALGLNEGDPIGALVYIEEQLAKALLAVRWKLWEADALPLEKAGNIIRMVMKEDGDADDI